MLTPIIINSVLVDNDSLIIDNNPKIYAAIVALIVALVTKSIPLTLISGLAIIWIFEFII